MSASILVLTLAGCAFLAVREWQLTNRQLRSVINEAQWLIAEARPESRSLLSQGKLGVFELRTAIKAFAEDLNSRENQRGRMATMRAGESVAALASRIEADTLPLLNQNLRRSDEAINAATGLLRNTDTSLNSQLLPEATRLLVSMRQTSDTFGVDSRAVLAEVLELARKGEVSLDAVNRVLASPEWLAILRHVEQSTAHIEATTAQMPATAASIEKISSTAATWQKPMIVAGLLATIARAFIP